MNNLHVRHVRDALDRDFRDLIDLSDIAHRPEVEREQSFYSRALAALAAQHASGCDPLQAAEGVVDGFNDGGIDCVVAYPASAQLWLIQSKWSDIGRAGFGEDAANKLRDALDHILNSRFDRFNSRFQRVAAEIDKAISRPDIKITLVAAVLGATKIAPSVESILRRIERDANSPQQMVDWTVLGLAEFHNIVRNGFRPPTIDLDVLLESAGFSLAPYLAYQGVVSAEEIARWHHQGSDALFERNIRKALGVTKVNAGIVETLLTRPDHFLYFNNGITVLCDSIQRSARGGMTVGAPIQLRLKGANVVNGAQTVASISEAVRRDEKQAATAKVWVRLISLEDGPDGLANEITVRTNTQNSVDASDFVALDATQPRLHDEFAMSLGLSYVTKRGDTPPDRNKGCTLWEAAGALACADPDVETITRAKQSRDSLFETGPKSIYPRLFNDSINVYRVWRAVLTLRAVQDALVSLGGELDGRGAQIARHGDLAVAHLVFQRLNPKDMANPDIRWEDTTLVTIPGLTQRALHWLIAAVDEHLPSAYPQTIFKTEDRVRTLAETALRNLATDDDAPQPPQKYRKTSGIDIIVNRGLIADGTTLEFRPTASQRRVLASWLKADETRARASWVNDRALPLVWAYDGKQYSPTELTKHLFAQVTEKMPARVNGHDRWFVAERGSLADIAAQARTDVD